MTCPHDTNGDGDCGRGACPDCAARVLDAREQSFAYVTVSNRSGQAEWSMYVAAVRRMLDEHWVQVLFEGFTPPGAPNQEACWGLLLLDDPDAVETLRRRLSRLAGLYWQGPIAWARGTRIEFIAPRGRSA